MTTHTQEYVQPDLFSAASDEQPAAPHVEQSVEQPVNQPAATPADQAPEYKPRVKELESRGKHHYYIQFAFMEWSELVAEDGISWVPGAREKHKGMVATCNALRRAIWHYAKSPEYLADPLHRGKHYPWRYLNEPGIHGWHLHKDILLHFADWMEFDAAGEAVIQQLKQEAEAAAEETRQRVMQEAEKREAAREKYAEPQVKYHVVGLDYSYHGYFIIRLDISDWEAAYDAACDGDKAPMERERKRLNILRQAINTYRREQVHMGKGRDTLNKTYGGYTFHLRADILLHFADWMEFDAPLEDLMQQAKEREHQRVLEHNARVREQRRMRKQREAEREAERQAEEERRRAEYAREEQARRWYYHCGVEDALLEFGLSRPVTLVDIKRQYRTLAKRCHPDIGGDAEQFKRLNHANQVLMSAFA